MLAGISKSNYRIFKKDKFQGYKIQLVLKLYEDDSEKRLIYLIHFT